MRGVRSIDGSRRFAGEGLRWRGVAMEMRWIDNGRTRGTVTYNPKKR